MSRAIATRPIFFMIQWTAATTSAWLFAVLLAEVTYSLLRSIPLSIRYDVDLAYSYSILLYLGGTIAILQGLVIKGLQIPLSHWASSTFIGFMFCLAIFGATNHLAVDLSNSNLLNNIVLLVLMGVAVGVCQSLVLRRYYKDLWIWILASTFAFLFFLWIILNPTRSTREFAILVTLIGWIGSVTTGVALLRMRRVSIA